MAVNSLLKQAFVEQSSLTHLSWSLVWSSLDFFYPLHPVNGYIMVVWEFFLDMKFWLIFKTFSHRQLIELFADQSEVSAVQCSFWWILAVLHRAGVNAAIVILEEMQLRHTRICTQISKMNAPLAKLTTKRSAGVAPKVNLRIPLYAGDKVHKQVDPSWLLNTGQPSSEVQNSGPTKRIHVVKIF